MRDVKSTVADATLSNYPRCIASSYTPSIAKALHSEGRGTAFRKDLKEAGGLFKIWESKHPDLAKARLRTMAGLAPLMPAPAPAPPRPQAAAPPLARQAAAPQMPAPAPAPTPPQAAAPLPAQKVDALLSPERVPTEVASSDEQEGSKLQLFIIWNLQGE